MLKLRKFTTDDADSYLKIANNKSEQFYPFSYCKDIEDALLTIEMYNDSEINGFAIERIEDKTIVGVIYMEGLTISNIEVGYFIGEPYRKHGYAKWALFEIEKIAKSMGKRSVKLNISLKNLASIRTAQAFGAKKYYQTSKYGCWQKLIK